MKLYYAPGACSLSPHIVASEAGIEVELVRTNLRDKSTAGGGDLRSVNPKGYVPVLEIAPGQVLTEGPAIVQYLADQAPASGLAPAAGSFERYRLQEWLNFISTELHKQFSPLFDPSAPAEVKTRQRERIAMRLAGIAALLQPGAYLMGEQFTAADAYLFTVLSWAGHVDVDLSPWPALGDYLGRVGKRPAVQAALRAEGLLR
jgi:glutathione S-transferase